MKYLKFLLILAVACLAIVSCGEKPDVPVEEKANIVLVETNISFGATGGTKDVTFKATGAWSVESAPSWITVDPSSGTGSDASQKVTVKAAENTGSERSGDVKFAAGEKTAVLKVTQAEAVVIEQGFKPEAAKWYLFRKADKVESGKAYIMVAKNKVAVPFASEVNYGYMNTTGVETVNDEIVTMGRNALCFSVSGDGYIISQVLDGRYLYMTGTYDSFNLGADLPADGHIWTISASNGVFSIKNKEKGKTVQYDAEYKTFAAYADIKAEKPCLYECIKETAAPVNPTFTEVPKWLELPATKEDDGLDFYAHTHVVNGKNMRNWAFDYDESSLLSHWIAYPLNTDLIGRGSRTDTWGYDPLVPVDKQPSLFKSYKGDWQRGHQLPSADRLDYDANVSTFYFTNMTPQNGQLNEGVWADLEQKVRDWSAQFDTLYVVTGCSIEGSTEVAADNDGKSVTVPVGYYKALLGYKAEGDLAGSAANGGFTGCAFWFDNAPYSGGYMDKVMTIAQLEQKTGVDFFVNLPSRTDEAAAQKIETTVDAWWK